MNIGAMSCVRPILASGGLHYQPGREYRAAHQTRGKQEIIEHAVTRDQCLVGEMLEDGRARATVAVVCPGAMFRRTYIADGRPRRRAGEIVMRQSIEFPPGMLLAGAARLHPAIVVAETLKAPIRLGPEHGVDSFWSDVTINLNKGDILTDHPWWDQKLGDRILKTIPDSNVLPGSFEVEVVPDVEFHFLMRAYPDLYESMRHPASEDAYRHVLSLHSAAIADGMRGLQKDYGDPEEIDRLCKDHPNLAGLRLALKKAGLPLWCDKDFSANQAAAAIEPHIMHQPEEYEEEGQP